MRWLGFWVTLCAMGCSGLEGSPIGTSAAVESATGGPDPGTATLRPDEGDTHADEDDGAGTTMGLSGGTSTGAGPLETGGPGSGDDDTGRLTGAGSTDSSGGTGGSDSGSGSGSGTDTGTGTGSTGGDAS
jgi:hypothetical protein